MAQAGTKEIFEEMPVRKALRVMAVPTIFSQLIILIYNLADTFFIGKTNNPYMVAGVSLMLPVFNVCLAVAGLAGIGGGTLISRLLGARREEEAKKVSSFCFLMGVLIAGVFSVVIFFFAKPIMFALGASEQTYPFAYQYSMCVIVLGAIPTVSSNIMSNLLRSVGHSREAGIGIAMGGCVNIVLDPLFMFVIMPKGREIVGVGLATLISNCLACCYFFYVIAKKQGEEKIVRIRPGKDLPQKESIKSVFYVGIPSAAGSLLFDLNYVVIDKLMSGYSDIALAAIGIVLKAERLPLNIGVGICQGMTPIVAYNYAAKNYKRMNDTIRTAQRSGVIVGLCSIVLYEIFASQIIMAFIQDPETVALGTSFLRARCVATPLMFLSFSTLHTFQGFGEGGIALFLAMMRWLAFNIPMLFIMNAAFGMYGIVWAQLAADVFTVSLSFCMLHRYQKRFESEGAA